MLVRLAIIGLLLTVLWMVTKRRDSLFKIKFRKPKTAMPYNKRIAEWKAAMNVISSATSQGDAVAKIKAARAANPNSSVYGEALSMAESKKTPQVPQIVAAYNKIISGLEKSKMKWLTKWLKSKKTRQLIYKEQIADAKKYGNTNDFVAAYQQKVTNLMSKSTTSTFKGEENIPDALRVQMYQKAISDMQKAGSVDKFVKSRQSILTKVKKAAGKAGRRRRASMVAKKSGGNYYFYFNSIK